MELKVRVMEKHVGKHDGFDLSIDLACVRGETFFHAFRVLYVPDV
jgi:hypothetical protein